MLHPERNGQKQDYRKYTVGKAVNVFYALSGELPNSHGRTLTDTYKASRCQ